MTEEKLRIIKLPEVKRVTGMARSTIYLRMENGDFPKSLKLGDGRSMGWIESEVQDWIKEQIKWRDACD